MHSIVMLLLESAMECVAGDEGATLSDEEQLGRVIRNVAVAMWEHMPHEWLAFAANILEYLNGKKTLVGAAPVIKNEASLTFDSFFDSDTEAERFLARRALYALHIFAQVCSGDERVVKHEYGLVLYHLQGYQDRLIGADKGLSNTEEWISFWGAMLRSVDQALQDAPLQGQRACPRAGGYHDVTMMNHVSLVVTLLACRLQL